MWRANSCGSASRAASTRAASALSAARSAAVRGGACAQPAATHASGSGSSDRDVNRRARIASSASDPAGPPEFTFSGRPAACSARSRSPASAAGRSLRSERVTRKCGIQKPGSRYTSYSTMVAEAVRGRHQQPCALLLLQIAADAPEIDAARPVVVRAEHVVDRRQHPRIAHFVLDVRPTAVGGAVDAPAAPQAGHEGLRLLTVDHDLPDRVGRAHRCVRAARTVPRGRSGSTRSSPAPPPRRRQGAAARRDRSPRHWARLMPPAPPPAPRPAPQPARRNEG